VLTWVLAAAALAAGVTGAWSPCGFSMVETLAPAGYAGRLRTTLLACATFAVGALAGGVATFAGLARLGQALGAGGAGAAAVAAVVAVAAAVGEARGVRIVPQVRRQVPESWRRVLPVPLAAGLYGVLLGLGFTTFILTFAVWALAAVSVALGDPALGAVVGLAFGAGRALPVIALAPVAGTDRGNAAHAAMAERPAILRGLRAADAVSLAACAAVIGAAPAQAARSTAVAAPRAHASATVEAAAASGPSAAGTLLAFQRPGGVGYLRRPSGTVALPGRDPALGAGLVGWRDGDRIVLADTSTLAPVAAYDAPGAGAFAFSGGWVVWAVGTSRLVAQPRNRSAPPRVVAAASRSGQLGRPALAGHTLVFHRAGPGGSQIRLLDLRSGRGLLLRSERLAQLLNPSLAGHRLLYVRSTASRQQLRIGPASRRSTTADRLLYGTWPTGRRDDGAEKGHSRHRQGYPGGHPPPLAPRPPAGATDTLWTTALGPHHAYVTRLRRHGATTTATLLRVAR
jgi:hypothetical protein